MREQYERAFGADNQIVLVGTISIPSGKVVACDPFFVGIAAPFQRLIPPADYRVELAVVKLPDWGRRIAMARLLLRPGVEAEVFEPALREGSDSNRYFVEAGLGSFMDELTRQDFAQCMARFYKENPSGNYYDDVLAKEFKENAVDKNSRFDAGDWDLHVLPGSGMRVAMFASGLGDGGYESFWANDSHGDPAALVTDFHLVD